MRQSCRYGNIDRKDANRTRTVCVAGKASMSACRFGAVQPCTSAGANLKSSAPPLASHGSYQDCMSRTQISHKPTANDAPYFLMLKVADRWPLGKNSLTQSEGRPGEGRPLYESIAKRDPCPLCELFVGSTAKAASSPPRHGQQRSRTSPQRQHHTQL